MERWRTWRKGDKGKPGPLEEIHPEQPLPNSQPQPGSSNPSPFEAPALSFPDGLKALHDCPGAATIDICFVHGLTGDRESTWTASGQSRPWPETLLPPHLRTARILTYGYDAYILKKGVASLNRLIDHAANLLSDLSTDRANCNASSRPLIFVAHSLGGLVCKVAILQSRNNPDYHLRNVFEHLKGIVFMGTPHKGAWMANWAKIPASAIGFVKSTNTSLLGILATNNEYLESIQSGFLEMVREQREGGRPLGVTCFFEEEPLPVAGMVVPKESATLESYIGISIHANHRNMAKFTSAEDNGFKRVLGVLVRWDLEARNSPPDLGGTAQKPSNDCLQSLAFPQMESRSYDIDDPLAGTCAWLRRHETFKRWAARDQGLLWIKGKPGSGKSTLLKYAVASCRDVAGVRDGDLVLSFFFHGRGDELQRTPRGLFQSVLHQILRQVPDALSELVDSFGKRVTEMGLLEEKWRWHPEELWGFFKSSLPNLLKIRPVWLFVDALDECGNEHAVNLSEKLKSLFLSQDSTDTQFHICFTCRHYPILDPYCELEICLENENQKDISTYVYQRLSAFQEHTSHTVPAFITERANGVFMWARLVVNRVLELDREGETLTMIEAELSSIPPDLHELYQRLIGGMKPASLKLIQWICFATRPLSLNELRWAMVVEADRPHRSLQECQSRRDYVPDNDRMKRQVQTLSCGLAEVIRIPPIPPLLLSGTLNPPKALGVVQFIHQSVKDFFLENGLLDLDSSSTSANQAIGIAHYRLSRICIRYLAMEEIHVSTSHPISRNEYRRITCSFPFLYYSITSWVAHTKEADDRSVPQEDILALFAWPSNALVERWVGVYRALSPLSSHRPERGTNLLHVSLRHHILGLLRLLINTGKSDINIKDRNGMTPLALAAESGHEAIVRVLIDTGKVDLDTKDQDGWTPLVVAAEGGHDAIVRLLIDTGKVDVDTKDLQGRTPLIHAAERGHDAVIRLLIDTGKVDLDTKDLRGRTPLALALAATSWRPMGHNDVIGLLLEAGAAGG